MLPSLSIAVWSFTFLSMSRCRILIDTTWIIVMILPDWMKHCQLHPVRRPDSFVYLHIWLSLREHWLRSSDMLCLLPLYLRHRSLFVFLRRCSGLYLTPAQGWRGSDIYLMLQHLVHFAQITFLPLQVKWQSCLLRRCLLTSPRNRSGRVDIVHTWKQTGLLAVPDFHLFTVLLLLFCCWLYFFF